MRTLLLLFLVSYSTQLLSQHRIAIYDVERDAGSSSLLDDVSSYIVGFYASDDRFIVIDKANSQLVSDEQDRQKSEEFIDGYIVAQGAQEGFDYLYYPKYFSKDKKLSIKVYDVAKGTVITNQSVEIKNSILGTPKDMKMSINKVVDKVNSNCFEIRYEVLRCVDKKIKDDAKELLLAVGYNQRAKEGDVYELYVLMEESVGGQTISRKEVVGSGKIDEVQDGNFSILKVSKGGGVIMTNLKGGTKIYGAPIIN